MKSPNIIACAAAAAVLAPAAVYGTMALVEAKNNDDVAACAAALGDVATVAAAPPQECLPNEANEYNGFTYHVSESSDTEAVTTKSYYDIPSAEAYTQTANTGQDKDLLLPFIDIHESAFYAFIGVAAAAVVYFPGRNARKDQKREAALQAAA